MNDRSNDYVVLVGSILMLTIAVTSTPAIAAFAVTTLLLAYIAHNCTSVLFALLFGLPAIASGALTIIAYSANAFNL